MISIQILYVLYSICFIVSLHNQCNTETVCINEEMLHNRSGYSTMVHDIKHFTYFNSVCKNYESDRGY